MTLAALRAAVMALRGRCVCRRSRSGPTFCSACEKRVQRAQSLMSPAGSPSTQRCVTIPAQYCISFSAPAMHHNACNHASHSISENVEARRCPYQAHPL